MQLYTPSYPRNSTNPTNTHDILGLQVILIGTASLARVLEISPTTPAVDAL